MRKFVFEKMLHKKWMCICLLIGNVLLVGIAVCNPLYYHAALNRMLQSELKEAEPENTSVVGEVLLSGRMQNVKSTGIEYQFFSGDYKNPEDVTDVLSQSFDVPTLRQVTFVELPASTISKMTMAEPTKSDKFQIAHLTDLKEHSQLVSGEWYSETAQDGVVECIVNEHTMMQRALMVGQEITLDQVCGKEDGKEMTLRIVGVFAEQEDDGYWMEDTSSYASDLFVSDAQFADCISNYLYDGGTEVVQRSHVLLDSEQMTDYNYSELMSAVDKVQKTFAKNKKYQVSSGFYDVLSSYRLSRRSVRTLMLILQVPLFLLLAVYIYMVSKQMLSMEENEIAMLKSRGASRRQILEIYLIQSLVVSAVSAVLGSGLGYLLCRVLGSADSFLQFVVRSNLKIRFSLDTLWFLLGACVFSTAVMVFPVVKLSRLTIVEAKQGQKKQKPALWKKLFVDVLLLAFTGYIYYNYLQQQDTLALKIASGGEMDYLLLLSSSLFIIGCGLLALRVMPWLIRLVFTIGKRFWKPELYASFLQIIRTSRKQETISLFLIMTLAMGIFNAATASTVNQNQEQELQFENGTDIILTEQFDSNKASVQYEIEQSSDIVDTPIRYTEPDYERYSKLADSVTAISRVFEQDECDVSVTFADTGENKSGSDVTLLAIEPKEYGQSCYFRDDLAKTHWYNWLNALAETYNGVLVSKEYAEKTGISIGDDVQVTIPDEMQRYMDYFSATVVGIVDYWPTMWNSTTELSEDGTANTTSNTYMIANFDSVMSSIQVKPYSIYIKTKDGDVSPVYDFVAEEDLKLTSFVDTQNELLKQKNNPILQVTNGILTISFLVVILLCATGFLIYWILSIRSRELLFGIYRAMGLSRHELKKMLLNEQLFSTLVSIAVGIGVGILTAKMYVPVMEITYLPGSQIIPLHMVIEKMDMARLGGAVCVMVVVCLFVLLKLVSRLKISQALKLGED